MKHDAAAGRCTTGQQPSVGGAGGGSAPGVCMPGREERWSLPFFAQQVVALAPPSVVAASHPAAIATATPKEQVRQPPAGPLHRDEPQATAHASVRSLPAAACTRRSRGIEEPGAPSPAGCSSSGHRHCSTPEGTSTPPPPVPSVGTRQQQHHALRFLPAAAAARDRTRGGICGAADHSVTPWRGRVGERHELTVCPRVDVGT